MVDFCCITKHKDFDSNIVYLYKSIGQYAWGSCGAISDRVGVQWPILGGLGGRVDPKKAGLIADKVEIA